MGPRIDRGVAGPRVVRRGHHMCIADPRTGRIGRASDSGVGDGVVLLADPSDIISTCVVLLARFVTHRICNAMLNIPNKYVHAW